MAKTSTSSRQRRSSRSQTRSVGGRGGSQRSAGGKSRRGFAAMSPALRREIASRGGRASHGGRGRDYVRGQSLSSGRTSRDDRRDDWDNRDLRRSDWETRRYNDGRGQRDYERGFNEWTRDELRGGGYRRDDDRSFARNDYDERGLDFRANRRSDDDRDLSDYYSDRGGAAEWSGGRARYDDDQGGSRSRHRPGDADREVRESGYRSESHWDDDARGFGRGSRGHSDFDEDVSEGRGHGRVGRERDAYAADARFNGGRSQRGRRSRR